ncbi:SDR family oxidoreductase [Propioniciclava coleopterorum]|uniref:SDR family oxidoreductase n=1 Tax=Propioniciclava coleopterorum TaxID=2714937 RepID=A0A6G7Y4F8_9ACTN|nr:SDR family oxidoreductase [Propioniciclava coleopterorum]QIK71511.1 SDR family oxidoreductase [Propioniciclava coleopterorum]
MDVRGKTFVVTGGGNGIGREIVLGLVRRGAEVAAVDLDAAKLAQTVALAPPGARISVHALDVTDAVAVDALPAQVIAQHGQVDGLLNVAGIIQRFVRFGELPRAEVERMMNVNFWGVVGMVQAFLPHLLERPAASLVNVSSMGGFIPVPGQTAYGASKAAVKLLTEGLRAELRGSPVAVTVVFPGAVGTNITANSGVTTPGAGTRDQAAAAARTTSPADAAETIIRGMERGSYRVFVGRDAKGLDALTRLAPERAMDLIAEKMGHLLGPR